MAEPEQPLEAEDTAGGLSEAINFNCPAVLIRRGFFDADGTLSLRDGRLTFQPSWLAQRSGPDAQVGFPIGNIDEVKLVGRRRELEVSTQGQHWRWSGSQVHEVFRRLHGVPDGGSVQLSWPARLRRGPLAHPGLLLLTERRLRFVSTSSVDAVVGIIHEIEIEIAQLSSVFASARGLSLQAAAGSHQFEVERAATVVDALAALMLRRPSPGEPATSERGAFELREDIEALFDPWPETRGAFESETLHLAGPVIVHRAGIEVARYALVLTDRSVRLVPPAADRAGREVQVFELAAVGPARDAPVADGVILIRSRAAMLPIFPRGAAAFGRAFWQCVPRSDPPPPPDPFAVAAAASESDLAADTMNRRGAIRLRPPGRIEVSIALRSGGEDGGEKKSGEVVEGQLLDLSADGLCVSVMREVPANAEVEVVIALTDARFAMPARTVYCRKRRDEEAFRCGLRVADGALGARLWLQRYWAEVQRAELRQRAKANSQRSAADRDK